MATSEKKQDLLEMISATEMLGISLMNTQLGDDNEGSNNVDTKVNKGKKKKRCSEPEPAITEKKVEEIYESDNDNIETDSFFSISEISIQSESSKMNLFEFE